MAYNNSIFTDYSDINQRSPFVYPRLWGNDDITNLENHLSNISLISKGGIDFKNFDYDNDLTKPFDLIHEKILTSNKLGFNFDLTTYLEHKYIEYSNDQTPNFHLGIGPGLYNQRKLTYIVHVNDSSEYEGGELHLFLNYDKIFKVPNEKGTMVVFPSYILHRITSITKGTKKVVTGFVGGKPFK